jgi:hypothetical protein
VLDLYYFAWDVVALIAGAFLAIVVMLFMVGTFYE